MMLLALAWQRCEVFASLENRRRTRAYAYVVNHGVMKVVRKGTRDSVMRITWARATERLETALQPSRVRGYVSVFCKALRGGLMSRA